jgi:hypothetical protein
MAIRAGADLVLGSGPHVLRGMEIYRGRLIAYSLGNFSGFHNFATSGVLGASAVLHVTVDKDGRSPTASPESCRRWHLSWGLHRSSSVALWTSDDER